MGGRNRRGSREGQGISQRGNNLWYTFGVGGNSEVHNRGDRQHGVGQWVGQVHQGPSTDGGAELVLVTEGQPVDKVREGKASEGNKSCRQGANGVHSRDRHTKCNGAAKDMLAKT